MYIKRIILKNIRGFEELDFDLTRSDGSYAGWTVFTGDNGSGKSALLKAIAIGLVGRKTVLELQPNFQGWIRKGADEATIQFIVEQDRPRLKIVPVGYISKEEAIQEIPIKIILTKAKNEIILSENDNNYDSRVDRNFGDHPWFSCGYGPFRRLSGASQDAARKMLLPTTERFATLFDEAASLAEVDHWLRELHRNSQDETGTRESEEEIELLVEIIQHGLLPNEITLDRVDSKGLWLKDRNGAELAWSDMSDGYRSILAVLTDILRHMMKQENFIRCYHGIGPDGKWFSKQSGVVLIDEVDAHLHPKWQQKIGFWLKRHFPNIQFLVTTHSPIICQAADDNGLFVLPEISSQDKPRALSNDEYNRVIASRPDTILLTSAFGLQNTRSPRIVEARAKYAKLKAKKRTGAILTPEEETNLSELKLLSEIEEEL